MQKQQETPNKLKRSLEDVQGINKKLCLGINKYKLLEEKDNDAIMKNVELCDNYSKIPKDLFHLVNQDTINQIYKEQNSYLEKYETRKKKCASILKELERMILNGDPDQKIISSHFKEFFPTLISLVPAESQCIILFSWLKAVTNTNETYQTVFWHAFRGILNKHIKC